MGKHEFLTPKAIANRIKAKGLQKLRWYCQLCHKQCRDENGFKCHSESEGHQRQLSLFASRPGKFLDAFSSEFEKGFLDELKRRFGTKRVHANLVYNEYIRDRHHTHMNSTMWTTLTGFVKYLGRTGKCVVDETPKGWYIAYINRDPEVLARQEAIAKKEKMDVDDEERNKRMIEKRLLELAKMGIEPGADDEEDQGPNEDEEPQGPVQPVKFSLRPKTEQTSESEPQVKPDPDAAPDDATVPTDRDSNRSDSPTNGDQSDRPNGIKSEPGDSDEASRTAPSTSPSTSSTPSTPSAPPTPSSSTTSTKPAAPKVNPFALAAKMAKDSKEKDKEKEKDKDGGKRKRSALEELMEEEERVKEKKNRKDYWVTPGIVVKVMNKTLAGGKYYKMKGVVEEVIDRYVAQIKMLDFGDILKLDQSHLETVIPAIGGKLKIVNGAYRGDTAILLGLDVDNFSAKVKLASGPNSGKVLAALPYEDICKTDAQ